MSGNFEVQTRYTLDDHEKRLKNADCPTPNAYRVSLYVPGNPSLHNFDGITYAYTGFRSAEEAIETCPKVDFTVAKTLDELNHAYRKVMLERLAYIEISPDNTGSEKVATRNGFTMTDDQNEQGQNIYEWVPN